MKLAWESHGFLRPGRYRVDPEEARSLLVDDERFVGSRTRGALWEGLERYLSRFFDLEEMHRAATGPIQLIHALWLGGSFVSAKIDPSNIDLTVLMDEDAVAAMKGREGNKWLTSAFNREARLKEFGVSPLRVGYRPIVSVFQPELLDAEHQAYLRDRGAWDDWWQRCRLDGVEKSEPTLESAAPRRGYLEVTL